MLLLFPSMRYRPKPITCRRESEWKTDHLRCCSCVLLGGRCTHFEQHVLLAGRQIKLVLIVIGTEVHDVRQQLFVPVNHFQLLLQRLVNTAESPWLKQENPQTDPRVWGREAAQTNLSDFVVVRQEHGQVLRLLNRWWLRHLSEELSSS